MDWTSFEKQLSFTLVGNKAGANEGNLCGVELRKARKARGFTLEEAAARLEIDIDRRYATSISPGHLAKIERGEKIVTDRMLWGLAKVYGVEVQELFPKEVRDV